MGAPAGAPADVLRWTAPPGCPTQPQVRAAVERYVGRPLAQEAVAAAATVDGNLADGFRLQLVVTHDGDSDARVLRDTKCALLADAAALVVAMAIDPSATARVMATDQPTVRDAPELDPHEAEVETDRGSGPVAPERPEVIVERARSRCAPGPSLIGSDSGGLRPACFAVGLGLPLQLGPLPRFGPGIAGQAALLWPRLRLELGGAFFFQQDKRLDDGRGVNARLGLGHARACARLGTRRLEFPLCGGLEAGTMYGEGVRFMPSKTDRIPWLGALADVGAAWSPRAWVALGAQAGVVTPLARYRLRAADLTVHEAQPVGLRLSLHVEARFD